MDHPWSEKVRLSGSNLQKCGYLTAVLNYCFDIRFDLMQHRNAAKDWTTVEYFSQSLSVNFNYWPRKLDFSDVFMTRDKCQNYSFCKYMEIIEEMTHDKSVTSLNGTLTLFQASQQKAWWRCFIDTLNFTSQRRCRFFPTNKTVKRVDTIQAYRVSVPSSRWDVCEEETFVHAVLHAESCLNIHLHSVCSVFYFLFFIVSGSTLRVMGMLTGCSVCGHRVRDDFTTQARLIYVGKALRAPTESVERIRRPSRKVVMANQQPGPPTDRCQDQLRQSFRFDGLVCLIASPKLEDL